MGSSSSVPTEKPTLYMFAFSAPCRAVMMTAAAIGLEMKLKKIDLTKGEHMQEAYLKINPDHTIPTLEIGSFRLWESRAIMQYLVDQYSPNHNLYPRDPVKRAPIDRLIQYDIGTLYQAVRVYVYPQLLENKPADPEKAKDVEKCLDYLENLLKNRTYLVAAHLTIADLTITADLSMLEAMGWSFEKWPKVALWRETIRQEPWYAKTNIGLTEFMKARKPN